MLPMGSTLRDVLQQLDEMRQSISTATASTTVVIEALYAQTRVTARTWSTAVAYTIAKVVFAKSVYCKPIHTSKSNATTFQLKPGGCALPLVSTPVLHVPFV